jgi:hypothetical protein
MELESSAIAGIFIPDILTPGQYYDSVRADNGCARPIKRLMLAVLADAIRRLQELDGTNTRRLTRRSPVTGASRIGAPRKRHRRKLSKEAVGYEAKLLADGGLAVAVNGSGNDVVCQESAIAPDGLDYSRPPEIESINGAADIDDADVNEPSWVGSGSRSSH